jgi:hypothetical protein
MLPRLRQFISALVTPGSQLGYAGLEGTSMMSNDLDMR